MGAWETLLQQAGKPPTASKPPQTALQAANDATPTPSLPKAENRPESLVVHLKREPCDVRIDRGTPWGNPFELGSDGDRATVIRAHLDWLATGEAPITTPKGTWNPVWVREHLPELRGKRLGCWCAPQRCHGETLAALAAETPGCWGDYPDTARRGWIQERLGLSASRFWVITMNGRRDLVEFA